MKRLLRLALATLFATGAAQAATISAGASYGPEMTDWKPSRTLSVDQFNGALGTLNKATFFFSGGMRADYDLTNIGISSQLTGNTLTGLMRFTLPTLAAYEVNLAASESVLLEVDESYTGSLSNGADVSDTLVTGLASFIGSGTFNVDVFADAKTTWSGGGNLLGGADTFATANVRVVYDYTTAPSAVPEPASLALVGLALSAAALGRRRRA